MWSWNKFFEFLRILVVAMNSSSLKPQLLSKDELLSNSNGPNEQRSVRQCAMEGESAIDSLPNEVLLMIIRLLSTDELLTAEQVCVLWKAVVNTCFATTTNLELSGEIGFFNGTVRNDGLLLLKKMNRYGPLLKSLVLFDSDDGENNIDWIEEIGDSFPNLSSLSLYDMPILSGSLSGLPVKCCQLTSITFFDCTNVTDEDMGIILKGLPGLKYLKWYCKEDVYGECFRQLGSNLEYLDLFYIMITPGGTSHILSRARKLQTLKINFGFPCDAHEFSKFCEISPLRKLKMNQLELSKEAFLSISGLCLLEKLQLSKCPAVDSDVLIKISLGCPNLKELCLSELPRVCDRGLKTFAKCKHLSYLEISCLNTVTDESLYELAKAGTLESLSIYSKTISDRGVSAILAQCPHLNRLAVGLCCTAIGDSTVDAAIQAVERRRRSSATLDQALHGSSTAMVQSFKANSSGYLLWVYMFGETLNRYKVGLSHPLLYLAVY